MNREEAYRLAKSWIDEAESDMLPFILIRVKEDGQSELLSNLPTHPDSVQSLRTLVEMSMRSLAERLGN